MGVDFYACKACGETFPDCGDFASCDVCGSYFCCWDCSGIDFSMEDDGKTPSCDYCRKEAATDSQLFEFLLTHYKLTREEVMKMYQDEEPDTEPETK